MSPPGGSGQLERRGGDQYRHRTGTKDALVFDANAAGADVHRVEFAPGGTRLAVISLDRQVRVFDIAMENPAPSGQFRIDGYNISSQARLSPDGTSLAVALGRIDGRQIATVWDVRTGRLTHTLRGHSGPVYSVALAADNRTLATASEDGTVKLWEHPAEAELDPGPLMYGSNTGSLALLPGGRFAVLSLRGTNGDGGTWYEWLVREPEVGRVLSRTPRARPWRPRGALAPGSRYIAGTEWETPERVQVWDAQGLKLSALPAEGVPGVAAWFGPSDKLVVLEPDLAAFRIWDLALGRPVARIVGSFSRSDRAALSPDGRLLLTIRPKQPEDERVQVWDVASGAVRQALKGHAEVVITGAWARNSARLATGDRGGQVFLWDVDVGHTVKCLTGHTGKVAALAFSPDGRRLFSGGADSTVRVWDPETGHEMLTLRHNDPVQALAVSEDGYRLATLSGGRGRVRIFDATPLPEPKK